MSKETFTLVWTFFLTMLLLFLVHLYPPKGGKEIPSKLESIPTNESIQVDFKAFDSLNR